MRRTRRFRSPRSVGTRRHTPESLPLTPTPKPTDYKKARPRAVGTRKNNPKSLPLTPNNPPTPPKNTQPKTIYILARMGDDSTQTAPLHASTQGGRCWASIPHAALLQLQDVSKKVERRTKIKCPPLDLLPSKNSNSPLRALRGCSLAPFPLIIPCGLESSLIVCCCFMRWLARVGVARCGGAPSGSRSHFSCEVAPMGAYLFCMIQIASSGQI